MVFGKIKMKRCHLFLLLIMLVIFLAGCARWPTDPNGGGNGDGQKLLRVRVDINQNGLINTEDGQYYIVFDTNKDAPFSPADDIEDWETGFYYIRLDMMGFFLGEVLESGSSEQFLSGTVSDKYFQIMIPLQDIGDPEGIHMNVITTDLDNVTYDALDIDYYIDTNIISTKTENDFIQDSAGGPDFDISQVTTAILIP